MYVAERSFPSFETPVGVQLPALNVIGLIVNYTKAVTFTFKNKLTNKKKKKDDWTNNN